MIDSWFSASLVDALGWTILHSLWQASLLAGILWAVSRIPRGVSARTRYRLAFGTLLGQFVWSLITFFGLYEPVVAVAYESAPPAFYLFAEAPMEAATPAAADTSLLFWVVIVWIVGAMIGALRLCWSFGRVRRMQRRARMAVPPEFAELVQVLANRLDLRASFRLGISDRISGPALVGHLRPMLLFPVAVINQLSLEEAEVVILHELAHLKRKDHWWNLLQCLLEVIFYYHPVIWWIGARIREEREHCCDDLVIGAGSDQITYAKTLLFFAQLRQQPASALALAGKSGGLLGRIQRFINQQNIPYQMKSRLFLLPLITLVALLTTAAYVPTLPEAEEAAESTLPLTEVAAPARLRPRALPGVTPPNDLHLTEAMHVATDSLPMGRHQVSTFRNGKSTEVIVEDGEIKELKIDGETIPPAEYGQHEAMVERMLGQPGPAEQYREYRQPRGRIEWYEIDGQGDTLTHKLMERHFQGMDNQMRGMEFHFEDMQDQMEGLRFHFEQLSDSNSFFFEDMSEQLREQFENMDIEMENIFQFDDETDGIFRWNGEDGGVFRFDFDGDTTFFNLDSTFSKSFNFYFDNDGQPLMPGQGLEDRSTREELQLRGYKRRVEEQDLDLRELDAMIERLEARKAEQMRRMESRDEVMRERNEQIRERRQDQERSLRRAYSVERERAREARERARGRSANPDYQSLIDQLQSEGLVDLKKDLRKIDMTESSLKINGKKTSAAAHQRYLEIFKQRYGNTLGDKFSVTVKIDED
ncbi:M56 family metallopeptidase [Lewinella sp. W8]|uniref:M56 family metallopeptidase n=1 Tax=Lewinella sp. W8 TaxID=2528208 RepID=UPI0010674291|nr:M56 family metallopeptidase [Lewinella sp. W8]MTB51185.1 hypothetical protein [Lewinella sp. W8]